MRTEPSEFKEDQRPVEQVSFHDVREFLEQLNAEPADEVFRLPTDAEWEYACRARGTDEAFAEALDDETRRALAWFRANSGRETHPVGRKRSNAAGLFDVMGNVAEWTLESCELEDEDLTGLILDDGVVDPLATGGERRVVRGGSWSFDARYVRAACRNASPPEARIRDLGFRLARGQPVRPSKPAAERGAGRVADVAAGGDEE